MAEVTTIVLMGVIAVLTGVCGYFVGKYGLMQEGKAVKQVFKGKGEGEVFSAKPPAQSEKEKWIDIEEGLMEGMQHEAV